MRQPKDLTRYSSHKLTNVILNKINTRIKFYVGIDTYKLFRDYAKAHILPYYHVTGEQLNKLEEAWYNEKEYSDIN